jgi:hypothetical protein
VVAYADGEKDVDAMTLGPGFNEGGPKAIAYGNSSVEVGTPEVEARTTEVADATSEILVLVPLQNTPARGTSDASVGAILMSMLSNVLIAVPLPLGLDVGAVNDDKTEAGDAVVSGAVEFARPEGEGEDSIVGDDSLVVKVVDVETVLFTSTLLYVVVIGMGSENEVEVVKVSRILIMVDVEFSPIAEAITTIDIEASRLAVVCTGPGIAALGVTRLKVPAVEMQEAPLGYEWAGLQA